MAQGPLWETLRESNGKIRSQDRPHAATAVIAVILAARYMAKRKANKGARGRINWWKLLALAAAVLLVGFFGFMQAVRSGLFGELPSEEELASITHEQATLVLASNGPVIGKVFAEDRTNVRYEDLPRHLIDALVATEDARFFSHQGVDGRSYVRVFFRTLLGRDRGGGGGSTISQQIIKNLYGRHRHGLLTVPVNKMKEALVAQRLERVLTKNDVLVLYFNSVPFGENVYGIEAAAQRWFSTTTRRLKVEEAAVLVGMLKANTSYNPRRNPERSRGRRDQVLELMADRGYLTPPTKDSLRALPLRIRYSGLDALDAYGYFTARVAAEARALLKEVKGPDGKAYDLEKDGLRIHTTLDTALQHAALRSAATHLATMQSALDKELKARKARTAWEKERARKGGAAWKRNARAARQVFSWDGRGPDTLSYRDSLWHYHRMLHGAVLMMEPGSGRIRAWVGGNDHRLLPYDLVEARRPIASTIKPVLYAAALEAGMTPCTYLDNVKRTYEEYDGWTPDNFSSDTTGGQVAMWYALARSMNLPTVDLYFKTGTEAVRAMFKRLGLPEKAVDNPAVALGAADISLRGIVRAYSAFARGGGRVEPRMIEKIVDAQGRVLYTAPKPRAEEAMSMEVAAGVTTMLQRAVNEGTGAPLRSRFGITAQLAGKTGTSQDNSDAWFVGYTPGLVIGAWVGAMDPKVHFRSNQGTGGQLALPIVGGVLRDIQRDRKLAQRHLLPFTWTEEFVIDMDCPARRSGVEGFLEELFGGKERPVERTDERREGTTSERKEEKKDKSFFERLFGKKRK